MRARTIGITIGAASLAFGVTDILFGKALARFIGAGGDRGGLLFRSAGMREVAAGVAGLTKPTSSVPIWTRFVADLGDLAAVGAVMLRSNPKRSMAALTFAIVAGVAAIDFMAARMIDRTTGDGTVDLAVEDPAFALNGS